MISPPARAAHGWAWIAADRVRSRRLGIIFENGRTEFFAAVPAVPNLSERGSADGCGSIYSQAVNRNELKVYAGRVTPVGSFLEGVLHHLAGVEIEAGASDQYRRAEVEQLLDDPDTGVEFEWSFRRMGSGPQGANDCRAFQRMVYRAEIQDRREPAIRSWPIVGGRCPRRERESDVLA